MKPNFNEYTLALIKDERIIFSSDKSGLRPLVECMNKTEGEKNCVLYDKVIGLAAAKLIVYSGIISSIVTKVVSRPALDYLKDKIPIEYETVTEKILNKERAKSCPMELCAIELSDEKFIEHVNEIFNY